MLRSSDVHELMVTSKERQFATLREKYASTLKEIEALIIRAADAQLFYVKYHNVPFDSLSHTSAADVIASLLVQQGFGVETNMATHSLTIKWYK